MYKHDAPMRLNYPTEVLKCSSYDNKYITLKVRDERIVVQRFSQIISVR